jgi:2-methylaconitate cis-trans-isomerase PrpF
MQHVRRLVAALGVTGAGRESGGGVEIPAVLMRGGTSRGLFFHEADLPEDQDLRDRFILAAYGSPDPDRRQVDGIGGATSATSKVAVIADGREHGVDVTYEFGQVSIDRPIIDRRGNCGNLSSAVGPYAVDEGLVPATDPVTRVRFLNLNTGKAVTAHVPTRRGRFDPTGGYAIPGVAGTGSCVQLDYLDPSGAVTGSLLPTGSVVDVVEVPEVGPVEMSIVDAANPLLFVRWEAVGLTGKELPDLVDADPDLLARLEGIRAMAGVRLGLAPTPADVTAGTPSIPKLAMVGPPRDYPLASGGVVRAGEHTLRASMMSMGRLHRSYALTGAICTSVAAALPGTVVEQATVGSGGDPELRIGHPSGVLPMTAQVQRHGDGWTVPMVSGYRTARRLMAGAVIVPDARLGALTESFSASGGAAGA